ncbi:uncharacterized protein METZ01_LOCUS214114 [marine metagenome]|uniref:Uncharacterized protein n=1 Tax=marine metagenome TaxID=408172 RepID=A0A382FEA1_9ZZZZ
MIIASIAFPFQPIFIPVQLGMNNVMNWFSRSLVSKMISRSERWVFIRSRITDRMSHAVLADETNSTEETLITAI